MSSSYSVNRNIKLKDLVRARDYYLSTHDEPPYRFYVHHSRQHGWKFKFSSYFEKVSDDFIQWYPDSNFGNKYTLKLFFSMDIETLMEEIEKEWESDYSCE